MRMSGWTRVAGNGSSLTSVISLPTTLPRHRTYCPLSAPAAGGVNTGRQVRSDRRGARTA